MPDWVITLLLVLLGIVVGAVIGFFVRVILHDKNLQKAKETYNNIIENGKKEAEKTKKEYITEAKQEIIEFKKEQDSILKEQENIVKEKKRDVENSERKVALREEQSNNRSLNLDKREETLNSKESKIEESKLYYAQLITKVEETIKKEETKLYEIASLTEADAKIIIMDKVKKDISQEIYNFIQEEETKAKDTAKAKAVDILVDAMQKYAGETTTERTVSVVSLPNDEIKGKIIGRDGRNIRSFEALTGVDLIIDDTPATIVLSGFDPIRREIAKRSMDYLVNSGRINAARIEEICEKSKQEVNTFIREKGEEALFKVNIGKVHPDLIKLIGRLHFRTSYGQNVLSHSVEMAFLAGKLASEIGENEVLARRAALFHDIGKSVDHEIEGSHVEIGLRLMEKYNEPKEVIDAIASHHGDKEPESIIAVLVATADTLSAGRPGARYQDNEDYIQRILQLEEVSNSIDGVEKSFAVQAGREIRVIVKPDQVDDASTFKIARQIKEAIESKLTYPGNIKVTVIRETRATEIAK